MSTWQLAAAAAHRFDKAYCWGTGVQFYEALGDCNGAVGPVDGSDGIP